MLLQFERRSFARKGRPLLNVLEYSYCFYFYIFCQLRREALWKSGEGLFPPSHKLNLNDKITLPVLDQPLAWVVYSLVTPWTQHLITSHPDQRKYLEPFGSEWIAITDCDVTRIRVRGKFYIIMIIYIDELTDLLYLMCSILDVWKSIGSLC